VFTPAPEQTKWRWWIGARRKKKLFCKCNSEHKGNIISIGEIRIMAFTYAPMGWAFCNGATLPIAQYQALYAVIGTTYGEDGRTNFMLPNLQGRAPIGSGNGPLLTPAQ
jgi:hypothetical protein